MRLRWRRWWLTYTVYSDVAPGRREQMGPFLTRRTALHAASSIWDHKHHIPIDLRAVKEYR